MSLAMGVLLGQRRLQKKAISKSSWRWSPPKEKEVAKTVYLRVDALKEGKEEEEEEKEVEKTVYLRVTEGEEEKEKEKEKEKRKKKEVAKTVFLRVDAFKEGEELTNWYVIKLSSKDGKDCISSQIKKRKKKKKTGRRRRAPIIIPILRDVRLQWRSCFVALGSTIYSTSSDDYVSSNVRAWDTTNGQQWEPVTPMNFKREGRYAQAVTADDGKIYVFGGIQHCYRDNSPNPPKESDDKFDCEVYDVSKKMWEPINPPPPPELITCLFSHDYDLFVFYDDTQCRIMFFSLGGRGVLLAYYARLATWELLGRDFLPPAPTLSASAIYLDLDVYRTRPAFSDNTIYWIQSDFRVCAYDLNLQMLIHGKLVGVPSYFWETVGFSMPFFHFREDVFYLIWLGCHEDVLRFDRIRISKLVGKHKRQGCLTAYVLSTETYLPDTESCSIGAVVL